MSQFIKMVFKSDKKKPEESQSEASSFREDDHLDMS